MKRISREHAKFDLMRLLDRYARARGSTLHNEDNQAAFVSDLIKDFEANRKNEILIHGLRVQAMFAYVAAALGRCRAIKEEDAGEVYTSNTSLRVPDFRVVTADNGEFFVEVKSHRAITRPFSLARNYLDGLCAYAETFARDLYVAIYWSRLKVWSLVRGQSFDSNADRCVLSISDAAKRSDMAILGDCIIGTIPSLTLKLWSDPAKPRSIGSDGRAHFTIGRAELLCGEDVIADPKEREIAWFLMNYGDWPSLAIPAEVENGEVIAIGIRSGPAERANPDENFEILGSLSEMVSRQYNEMTASGGRVDLLAPKRDPDELGVLIPPGFKGDKLRLWFFVLQPSGQGMTS